MRRFRTLSVLFSCLLAASCASNGLRNIKASYSGISPEYMRLGDKASAIAQATRPIIHDRILSDYLRAIRTRLLANTGIGKVPGRIYVLADRSIYAYSLPNGDIFITTGLLRLARSEDQLSAVIGHELGHILLGHYRRAVEQQEKIRRELSRSDARAGYPQKHLDAAFAAVMHFGASRTMETEADRAMLQLQEHAGYDPCGVQWMFAKLVAVGRQTGPAADRTHLFDTHPATPERLHALEAQLHGHKCSGTDPGPSESYRVNVLDRLPAQ